MVASLTLAEFARHLDLTLQGGQADEPVRGLATLAKATSGQIAFLANPKYRQQLAHTRASAVILHPDLAAECPVPCLLSDNPYLSYAKATALFAPAQAEAGIHPSAVLEAGVACAEGVSIGPHCHIEAGVKIGAGTRIGAACFVGRDTEIGSDCSISPRVSIYHGVHIGDRVCLHSGVVIGADGFGFAPDNGRWVKIHQLGGVQIGDDVEIGANSTVDRGALDDTIIGPHVIIDDQVMIAHNVEVGEGSAIAGCVGIAGSSIIGKHCTLAGGVGVVGHVSIADRCHITAMSIVTKNIDKEGSSWSSGTGMQESGTWRKNAARFSNLDALARRLSRLEKQ